MATVDVREDFFPSRSKEVSGLVNGIATEITYTSFADKILITISQEGRLSQWVIEYSESSSSTIADIVTDTSPLNRIFIWSC
jgi:proteasome assembly chaperone 3